MIFVTVGTHEQPFNRLIQKIDELKKDGIINEDVIIQTGFSTYEPKYCQWSKLIPYQQMVKNVADARIVITHGGPASFIMPLQIGKTPIVVPRQHQFNEHVNDHQVEFARNVAQRMGTIIPVEDIETLGDIITNYDQIVAGMGHGMSSNNAKFNEELEKLVDDLFGGGKLMKELLIMAKSLGGGGFEVALIELINALPEELYNITLVLLDSDNEYDYRLKKNVNIVQLTFNSSFAKSLVSMYAFPAKVLKKLSVNSFIPYYDFISNCVTNVFEKTYDIAIDFYGYGSFVTAFLATKIQAKKKATWLHDEKPYWMKSVQKYLCEYDKIYGVSQAVVDAFCREYPHYKDKAAVFYNVIDIEEIKRKSEQDEIIPFKESFNIVTVGRLTEQKGYDIAIKAASILKKRKINFAWYAIGGGRDEKKLKKLVEKYCLENQFVFLGRKKNPYPYMKHCDLYVQPSRHEGYVITLVEARALCLPILSSDIPSAREQIQDGINGYVAELSAEDLADKIEYLYNNPSQRKKTVEYLKEHPIDFSTELLKLEII